MGCDFPIRRTKCELKFYKNHTIELKPPLHLTLKVKKTIIYYNVTFNCALIERRLEKDKVYKVKILAFSENLATTGI